MPKGCVITRYAELSAFLYNGFAIRFRIFSCRLARSNFLFLFLPIVRQGAVKSNIATENRSSGAGRRRHQKESNDARLLIDAVGMALSLLL